MMYTFGYEGKVLVRNFFLMEIDFKFLQDSAFILPRTDVFLL